MIEQTNKLLENMDDVHMQVMEHKDHLEEIIEKMETLSRKDFNLWLKKMGGK